MKGVLLINLGSPEHNDLDSVKKFLREFLNDKFVINLPKFIRNFIVNLIIVPFRSTKTLKAYNSIWINRESPIIRNIRQKIYRNRCKRFASYYDVLVGPMESPNTFSLQIF